MDKEQKQAKLDIHTKMHRLEQQLSAFEKLHKNELAEFERKLAIYKQLHKDEITLLLEEVAKLKEIVESQAAMPSPGYSTARSTS